MNDERRPARNAAANPIAAADDSTAAGGSVNEIERLRAGIVHAIDALEDGDDGYAVAILRALDEPPKRAACPYCPRRFEWPGLRDDHVFNSHPESLDEPRAA